MSSKYRQFIFKAYDFDRQTKNLRLLYGFDSALTFCEHYKFDFDFIEYDEQALDRALQLLFFMAGVSYFKTYLAPHLIVEKGQIDARLADFLGKTYQKGLGEFFFVNHLNPQTTINFPTTSDRLQPLNTNGVGGLLVGLGGGKDSLVSVELLRDQPKLATWSLNHRPQLAPLVKKVGLPHFWVERAWDQQLPLLNNQDAMNGHIPISAIFSCVGIIVGILTGYRDVIVSNESSASQPTLSYQNLDINHQYSKSLEYEKDYQTILASLLPDWRYYSLLRPFSELRIAELFAKFGFDDYLPVFSSCNRAFRQAEDQLFWCGECAKCAFVFLVLTPFVSREKLQSLWGGNNLLQDPTLEKTYRQLLGIEGDKPLDCVGEVLETRTAMRLAQKTYPELLRYQFELPETYDFRAWSEHSMPQEIFTLLRAKLAHY